MSKKAIGVLSIATALFSLFACNNAMTTTETKDSTTKVKMDSSTTIQKGDAGMMQPVTSMMERMSAVKLTGDVDNDFAALMMAHHQGAVDISEMEVAKGSDSAMITMAKTMIADHKAEIEQLKGFSSEHASLHKKEGEHHHEAGAENDLAGALKTEGSKMSGIKLTGNADKDYAMLMQAHHEDAVAMSKAEVAHGDHAELKKMAQKMMADDEKEIKTFKDYLSSNK